MDFYIGFVLLMLIPLLVQYMKIYAISSQVFKRLSLFLACGMLFFVMACRSINVGADTKQYLAAFEQLNSVSLKESLFIRIYSWSGRYTYSLEFGYRLYNRLVGFFFKSEQAITIFNSLFIVGLLFRLIWKRSTFYLLSIWMYITLGFFQTEMNMARNAIAILICLNATEYIDDHKLVKYILSILAACSFHMSSMIFIPVYWLTNYIRLTEKRMKAALVLSLFAGFILPVLNPILMVIVPQRYIKYLTNTLNKIEGVFLAVLFLGLFIFIWIFVNHKQKICDISRYDNIGNWLFILMVASFSFSYSINTLTRVAALFSPYLIIYFPRIIHYGITDRRKKRFVIITLFILCLAQYVFRLAINNIGGTIPYEFFWEG